MPRASLSEYNKKRNFKITSEPEGKAGKVKDKELAFVIQKHGARRLHYDFRLELDGVMKSWAVTRGPSYDPNDKRLAVRTEDHPISYNSFEGNIPEHQYGAGAVMIWDNGTWIPDEDPHKGLKKGHLTFHMDGNRMHGHWHLVRMHGKEKRENWLLIKGEDDYVLKGKKNEKFLEQENISVISGRTLEEIKSNVKSKKPVRAKKVKKKPAANMSGLQKIYGSVELATLVENPPSEKGWLHEIKYDGYRIVAFIKNGNVLLQTRGKQDWTHKFPGLVAELEKLKITDAVLDGEACVLNEKGQTSFSALQAALSDERPENIEAWFFDLLHLNGKDYTKEPLVKRKAALQKILKGKFKKLHYSDHFESSPQLLDKACKIGAEGIVSKQKNSFYKGRRTHDWVKSKCGLEQEFVIGGFMPAKQNSKAIGALLLGYYKGGKFLYAGKVGTGFNQKTSQEIYNRLIKLKTDTSHFKEKVGAGRRAYTWVKPIQLCEISFWEWTPEGHIRHASFKGLREDKAAEDVHDEKPKASAKKAVSKVKSNFTIEGITISHPEREVYPGMGITKGDVAAYYAAVMPYLLPFAENRLLSLMRCTETIAGECFFQRAPMQGGKGNVMEKNVVHKGSKHNYLYIEKPAGIIELVQMGSIEFHAWQSKVDHINKPDQMIFDLDPAEDVPFEAVKLAALDVRKRLKAHGLESFARLSGGKGVHIVAPIKPKYEWDVVKTFTQDIAREMQRDVPEAYISNMSKQKRKGKIFIDYLRNDFSSTAIVPFSLRARKNAPIAIPIDWKALEKIKSAHEYTYGNYKKILNAKTQKIIDMFFAARIKAGFQP